MRTLLLGALLLAAPAFAQEPTGTTGATAPEGPEAMTPPPAPRVRAVVPPPRSVGRAAGPGLGAVITPPPVAASPPVPGACMALVTAPGESERYTARVLVRPERRETRRIPAAFAEEDVQVTVRPARVERIPVPATWRTVTETVVVRPERVRLERSVADGRLIELRDPALVSNVTRRVIERPASVETRAVPAVVRTERRRREVTPERTETVVIPAEWREVERVRTVGPAAQEWRPAPCVRDLTPERVRRLEAALAARGHVPVADGVWDERDRAALEAFQRSQRLHAGALTLETTAALGLD